MLPASWLDDVFADPSKAAEQFKSHPRLREAFEVAEGAFLECKKHVENNPTFVGPAPAQAAAGAFAEHLDIEIKRGG